MLIFQHMAKCCLTCIKFALNYVFVAANLNAVSAVTLTAPFQKYCKKKTTKKQSICSLLQYFVT